MNREEKQLVVEQQKQAFQDSESVVVFHYRGTTVSQMNAMRQSGYDQDVTVKVTKNTLTRLAVEGTKFEGIKDLFSGPTAIAYSTSPVATAKLLVEAAKSNDNIEILGGGMGEKALDVSQIKALAELPGIDELRAKIIGVISAPAQKLAAISQAPAGQLARVIKAHADKG